MVSDSNRLSSNSPDPRLLAEWDYERNKPLTPRDVSIGSNRKVWWACPDAPDHRWRSSISHRVSGQGCPFCAGNRVSSTNRLSIWRPDLAGQLDSEASGITADQLSTGSNRRVTWRCEADSRHVWQAVVNNRTSGRPGRGAEGGTGCPYCELGGTSAQELQLKAELTAMLPVEIDRGAVPNAHGRAERADIVILGPGPDVRVIVEFDGWWWHNKNGALERDAAKSQRLRDAGWVVIRVRENLSLIDPEFDIAVELQARVEEVAAAVLDRMARLGLAAGDLPQQYRELSAAGPINTGLARRLIRSRLSRQRAGEERQSQDEAWDQMYSALGNFASENGHCRVPEHVQVGGVSLGRWVHKQRTRYRRGDMPIERSRRLEEIPGWSFEAPHVNDFWAGRSRYLAEVNAGERSKSRSATLWASAMRARRERLRSRGKDLPSYQLEAMANVRGWQWNPSAETFDTKVAILRDCIDATKRSVTDIRERDMWEQHKIGAWVNSWRTRRDRLPERQRQTLEELPGWTWSVQEDQWETKFRELEEFGNLNGHTKPSLTTGNEHERSLAVWKRNNKNRLSGRDSDRARRLRHLLSRYGEQMA